MGSIVSYLVENTGRTDDPDPATRLTSRDRYVIKTTWKKLSSGEANLETGMAIFLNLFEKNPQYKQLFPFKDIPKDQLRTNAKFKAHCVTVMYTLSAVVDNVDTPVVLEQLLLKQGINHVPRNIPTKAYEVLNQVLKDIFAKSMNPVELQVWIKFLDFAIDILVKGANSA